MVGEVGRLIWIVFEVRKGRGDGEDVPAVIFLGVDWGVLLVVMYLLIGGVGCRLREEMLGWKENEG